METKVNVSVATEQEKDKLVRYKIDNLIKEDYTLTQDEEIDSFFFFNKTIRDVRKIEISFNGIERTLFSALIIKEVEEAYVYTEESCINKYQKEKCYTLEYLSAFYELVEDEIRDITLDDFIRLGCVANNNK